MGGALDGRYGCRLVRVLMVMTRVWRLWKRQERLPPEERTRGKALTTALSSLGPVFVKVGQVHILQNQVLFSHQVPV